MPKRHDNTIYKLFLRSKKTIKATLSSMTRIGLIIYIKDPKEAPGVDYAYIKEQEVILTQYYSFLAIWEGVKDLPDNNNKGEIDYIITSMEIKEKYKIYFMEFREVNSI